LLLGAGQALIQGFIDGIKGMVGAIGDAVGGVLDVAKQFFPHSPAKRGPFSGKGYTSFSGVALASDFAKGIGSQESVVASAASGLMSAASLNGLRAPGLSAVSSGPALHGSSAGGGGFPRRLALMVGGREFDGYLVDTASGVVAAADSQSTYVRPGRR